jgi:DNA-binding MarR family transcriptional regulator
MGQPGHLARRLQQASYLLWTSIVSEEVTAPQLVVLNVLAARPGVDQRTLGELGSLDRSTVADVVSRLVRRGLVERLRDPEDRRRNVLQLTLEGRTTLVRLAPRTATMNRILLSPLTPDQQEVLLELLGRLVEAGERLRAKGP